MGIVRPAGRVMLRNKVTPAEGSLLVPKLCLGTPVAKLGFASCASTGLEAELRGVGSQAELGNQSELQPAVFLDRDGVLNRMVAREGTTHPPASVEEFAFLPGAVEAVRRLHVAGLALVVVTNQPDVARGRQTRQAVEAIHRRLCAELPMLEVLVCFHDDGDGCSCRKPKPGLLLEAAQRRWLDLHRSFLVGDRWSDVIAGQKAGCRAVLIETPHSRKEKCRPDRCVRDLTEAAEWILAQTRAREVHEAVR